ncbi:MAG: hypothetical protein WA146_04775 [Thiobacillus sp.]
MNTGMKITACLLAGWACLAAAGEDDIRHGRYLIQIGGCNDCHTAGFMQNGGRIAEADWPTGDAMGWQGPWGPAPGAIVESGTVLCVDLDVVVREIAGPHRGLG